MKNFITIFFILSIASAYSQNIDYDLSGQFPISPSSIDSPQDIEWSSQSISEATAFTVINAYAGPSTSLGDLTYDGKALWLATFDGLIYKINPQDGTVITSISSPINDMGGMSFAYGHLWAAQSQGTTIYKVEPSTGSVVGTFSHSQGDYVHGMQFIDGNIHVNMFYLGTTDTTFVLDTTGTVLGKTPNNFDFSHGLTYDGCSIWMTANNISGSNDAYLFRKDPTTFATLDMEVVPGGFFANGIVWDGNYLWVANNASDSLFQLQLNTPTSTNSIITESACDEFVSPSGKVWMTSGMYMDTIANVGGCDSLMTIDLTINTIDTSLSANNITLTSNAAGATYQWIDCDNGNAALTGETGQSFTASINGNYAVVVSENGCQDTSECFAINTVGIYDNSFGNTFSVFPNPSNGSFEIDLGQEYADVSIRITSITGQKMFEAQLSKMDRQGFDIAAPVGLYLIHIKTGEKSAVVKMLMR